MAAVGGGGGEWAGAPEEGSVGQEAGILSLFPFRACVWAAGILVLNSEAPVITVTSHAEEWGGGTQPISLRQVERK